MKTSQYIGSGYKVLIIIILGGLFSCDYNARFQETQASQVPVEYPYAEKLTAQQETALARIFTSSLSQSVDSLMQKFRKTYHFNGSVLVGYHGMMIYNQSFGYKDFTKATLLQPTDPMQLASVSKQFTAMAVMILADRGKIAYNDTVCHHIPGFPYPRITIEQLLHHTSGLPNYMWLLEHKWPENKPAYNDDIIRLMREENANLYFTPGRKYDYSNTGYAVLAYLVEVVSGMRFADFMEQEIFKPLGMYHTFVYSNALNRSYPEKVPGFYIRWRQHNPVDETTHDGIVGDKGIYSTTEDLFKWDQALYTEKLVSKKHLEKAFTKLKVQNRWEYPYGYGFRIKKVNGKKVVYHTGLWEGFRTNLMRYVEDHNTIIVMNNDNRNINNYLVKRLEPILERAVPASPTYYMVVETLKKGPDKGLEKYYELKKQQKPIHIRKILEAAEYLSKNNKPVLSGELLKLYEKVLETTTLEERLVLE
jgi:CubicO group peptidase (beta-lactamase class C family)